MTISAKLFYIPIEPIKQMIMKVRVTIEVDPKLKEEFLQKAKSEGRSMKWLIEKYMKDYIDTVKLD